MTEAERAVLDAARAAVVQGKPGGNVLVADISRDPEKLGALVKAVVALHFTEPNGALLPCPFCGAAAEAWVVDDDGCNLYAAAGCRSQSCSVKPRAKECFGLRMHRERGERQARTEWNERAKR